MAGCAQNVGDIDRTQPHKSDASIFTDGKPWWFLQTVVDVPPTTQFSFVGESSFPPDRIVWDVQENWLIAYRSYEFILGGQTTYSQALADGLVQTGMNPTPVDQQDYTGTSKTPYFGTPVAAYPILSHFDVEREYNPQTGEQDNVIVENTTDRPWYERQYIRTDWSNNAFGGFHFLSAAMGVGEFDPTQTLVSPVAYYPDDEDPTNKDRAEITPGYIGIVNKLSYAAEVDTAASQYYGSTIYKCMDFTALVGTSLGDCGPGEVKIRLSFEKIPDTHDYVPREYTDKDEQLFGMWQQTRSVYDPQRGYLESNLAANSFAVMHHIWQKDHLATDSKTGNACDVNDMGTNPNCVMPLNQRTPKPIIYYVSDTWPAYGDPTHKTMWQHAGLLSEDYDDDMRGVTAAALRGGPNSVENWMQSAGIPVPDTSKLQYGPNGSISYGTVGLDYLAYPPDTRYLDPQKYGYEGVRANETVVKADGSLCSSADLETPNTCSICDPTKQYCMGIGHVPYSVVPRMFMMCHNPVMPRVVKDSNGNTIADKSDSTKPASFDFSTPGDPDACDPRTDAERIAQPLNPQMGDLRYHMLAWVQQPDDNSPGGIGEPAMDPVTGEIVTAHAYIYARAVENLATYGADLVTVMNGWENVSDFLNGSVSENYVQAQLDASAQGYGVPSHPPPVFAAGKLSNFLGDPAHPTQSRRLVEKIDAQVMSHQRDPGVSDWTVSNWYRMTNDPHGPAYGLLQQPLSDDVIKGFAPTYAQNGSQGAAMQLPQAVAQSISLGQMIAPPAVSHWNQQYKAMRAAFTDRHILGEDEVEPTAVRLAQYYQQKFQSNDPCKGSYSDTTGADYKTCIWEAARQEILGNLWRSYSNHEVGHTFGQYHNFAGSTDALNYFDPYWAIRQENTIPVSATTQDPNGQFLYSRLGTVPAIQNANDPNNGTPAVLAPEWLQAPSMAQLGQGLREYQYTSIMDYNAKFNSDFQGLGKYDHACRMYAYAGTVEVFDPTQLPNVPANVDTVNHAHQVHDTLLVPFNRHYTMYPWLINDGLQSELMPNGTGKQTPLAEGIAKMIHARKWVRYADLLNPQPTDALAKQNGLQSAAELSAALEVPYRFCSDIYNTGEAHCLWFDEGADAYEQANGFIQLYKLNYLFNNFKLGRQNFDVFDNMISYQSHLWERNFNLLVTIYQQMFNDEFIVRYQNKQIDSAGDPMWMCPENGLVDHIQGFQCGLDRMAATVNIVDFFTKVLQTPTTDTYNYATDQNTFCPSSYGLCGADGFTGVVQPGATTYPGASTPVTLLPGDDSKYDLSQYSLNEYGHLFLWKPSVIGIYLDKILAINAMADPNSYIVGQLNSQPLSFLLSINDLFFRDVEPAIGGLIADDPKWAPMIAWYTANPADPAHPPITVYRNSHALQSVSPQSLSGPINKWCPAPNQDGGNPFCSGDPSIASFDQDPAKLTALGYTVSKLDPGPVYFEKLAAAYLGAVWLTAPIDNQQFIQSLKVSVKGNTNDAAQLQPLTCTDGAACNLGTPACEDGTACTPGATAACSDGSLCLPRSYLCSDGKTACAGICQDPTKPTATTCNPQRYSEVTDAQSGYTYYATRYVPAFGDVTDGTVGAKDYYSTGYQLVQLAAKQQATNGTSVGVGAGAFLDILRGIYYYWSTDPMMNN
ncbi:MAG: hypothetical protein ACYCWW_08270 [Deltaproteobacteria bacterium]